MLGVGRRSGLVLLIEAVRLVLGVVGRRSWGEGGEQ